MENSICVWVNGCFDILHPGHIQLLRYAKSLGDKLYVGLDGDSRIRKMKGPGRPYFNLFDRSLMLDAIRYVDVIWAYHTDDGLRECIQDVSPDIMVVGSDWKGKPIIGSEYAKEVKYFERIADYSTTRILQGISSRRDV